MNYIVKKIVGESPSADDWAIAGPIELVDSASGEFVANKCTAKMLWGSEGLFVQFNCRDEHIWGTYENDDDPIYNEEVVEIFIAKGAETPKEYFEFQFSPRGVKFDAKIKNPTGDRKGDGFNVNVEWNCEGLELHQEFDIEESNSEVKSGKWKTTVMIPARTFGKINRGDKFRANLFRIDGWPSQNSFQSWMPTMKDPADFHVPDKFAEIELVDS